MATAAFYMHGNSEDTALKIQSSLKFHRVVCVCVCVAGDCKSGCFIIIVVVPLNMCIHPSYYN